MEVMIFKDAFFPLVFFDYKVMVILPFKSYITIEQCYIIHTFSSTSHPCW